MNYTIKTKLIPLLCRCYGYRPAIPAAQLPIHFCLMEAVNTVSSKEFAQISSLLAQFVRQTRCEAIVLVDESGLALARAGIFGEKEAQLISSLAAANHAATEQLSRLIGEKSGFKNQFHEGCKRNLCLVELEGGFLLVVCFSERTTFGLIHVVAQKVGLQLRPLLLRSPEASRKHEEELGNSLEQQDFQNELVHRLDQAFAARRS